MDQMSRFWLCFLIWLVDSGFWTDKSPSVLVQNQSSFGLLQLSLWSKGKWTRQKFPYKVELTLSCRLYVIPLKSAIVFGPNKGGATHIS